MYLFIGRVIFFIIDKFIYEKYFFKIFIKDFNIKF